MPKRRTLPGHAIADVEDMVGLSRKTIYRYVQAGLVPRPSAGGRSTRYTDEQVERIARVRDLTAQHRSFDVVRSVLESEAPSALAVRGGETWRVIALRPGLAVCVASSAAPATVELARRMVALS